ncbi:AAA domain containing protein [uncultured Caudovirales phage]|uniref:AAA domain containing protein n=1 Tax=uncultured Caudovirales phage TaxID=2100421 RepID=A0A6J5KYL9_9CAUD|nr:AAA domain containing protein [uncultured Caudovirales phage]
MNIGEVIDKLTVSQEAVQQFYNEEYSHAEFKVKSTDIFANDLVRYFGEEIHSGKSLGWIKTEDKFRVRQAELTVLTGVSGHGKSMWLSQVILAMMKQNTKCLIASLEMRPVLTLSRMLIQTLGSPEPTDSYITEWATRAKDKLFLYDQLGTTTSDDMFATLYYGKHILGVEVFVIDSLMKMSDISEESLEKQKLFVDRLAVTCRDLNIHVFLVAHTRKMKSEDEIPDATNIMGSSHIRNLTDNIICVWRNRAKEKLVEEGKTSEEELKIIPDAKVFVQKARNSQWEGSFNFWFDQKGLKYKESPNAR